MALGSPTIISGARSTNDILADSRVVYMHDEILLYEPSKNPLSLLASSMSRVSVYNPDFKQQEDELIPDVLDVDTGITAGDTAVTVSSGQGSFLRPNTLISHQGSGEVALVTAIATDDLTITRSVGGTAAAAWTAGDDLLVLGGAAAEGATSETSITTKKVLERNYTQIVRWPFEITETDRASRVYGQSELSYQQMKAGIEWAKKLDMTFFFSEKSEDTTNDRRTTGGLKEFISSNTLDMGGTFSYISWIDFLQDVTRYSEKHVGFVSRGLMSNIALEGLNFIETRRDETTLGVKIMTLQGPFGEDVKLIVHNSLKGQHYGGYGFFIDPDRVGYRYLSGNGVNRDVRLKTNIQANDKDSRKDEFIGEVGLFRANEARHGLITNAGTTASV